MDSYFAEYMLYLRKTHNLTQKEAASIFNCSEDTIRGIENHRSDFPSKKLLSSIAKHLKSDEITVKRDILFFEYRDTIEKDYNVDTISLFTSWFSMSGFTLYFYELDENKLAYNTLLYETSNPTKGILNISFGDYVNKYDYIDEISLVNHAILSVQFYEQNVPGLIKKQDYVSKLVYKNTKDNLEIRSINFVFDADNKKETKLFNELKSSFPVSILKTELKLCLFDFKTNKLLDVFCISE